MLARPLCASASRALREKGDILKWYKIRAAMGVLSPRTRPRTSATRGRSTNGVRRVPGARPRMPNEGAAQARPPRSVARARSVDLPRASGARSRCGPGHPPEDAQARASRTPPRPRPWRDAWTRARESPEPHKRRSFSLRSCSEEARNVPIRPSFRQSCERHLPARVRSAFGIS